MNENQYIGPFHVLGVSLMEHKTPTGGEILRVQFEAGHTKIMTKRTFDMLVRPEPRDATSVEEEFLNVVVNGFFEYLKEYDLTAIQLESLLLQTSRVAKGMFDRASHIAFTKEVFGEAQIDSWVRGAPSFTDYRTLNECEIINGRSKFKTE